LQAAALRVKLRHLDRWNELRRAIASRYLNGLGQTNLVLPFVPNWADPVWHLFVVRNKRRDALQQRLNDAEIDTLIHYPIPPHLQGAYADLGIVKGALPVAERIHEEVLSLPIFPTMTSEEVNRVIDVLLKG
jgi:dTDP-4-amino-4,6-dideoxygalactose transaminase